jgi:hypothetical protein
MVVDHIVSAFFGPDTSYIASLTGTCGLKIGSDRRWDQRTYDGERVRLRVWVMLDRPISCAELAAWSIRIGADRSQARVVQPVFTSRPQWLVRPGVDPLAPLGIKETCWLTQREYDVVCVPDDLQREANMRRAEGSGGTLGDGSPDLDTALLRIGSRGENTAKGEIYTHLCSAVWHLHQMYPRDLDTDIPTHAQRDQCDAAGTNRGIARAHPSQPDRRKTALVRVG